MAVVQEKNSILEVAKYNPLRCDTHFKHNIRLADNFFQNPNIEWVLLGSVLKNIRNGMNLATSYYSMEETQYKYISVSQIKEYGLVDKNQNFLVEGVQELSNYFELKENMILVTRSGTIGVAISTSHPSFKFDEYSYIASGFVITAEVIEGISADVIANYINMYFVQRYLVAMSAGACQKNISQPVISNLPIPSVLLRDDNYECLFEQYQKESINILEQIAEKEKMLEDKKIQISELIFKDLFKE